MRLRLVSNLCLQKTEVQWRCDLSHPTPPSRGSAAERCRARVMFRVQVGSTWIEYMPLVRDIGGGVRFLRLWRRRIELCDKARQRESFSGQAIQIGRASCRERV